MNYGPFQDIVERHALKLASALFDGRRFLWHIAAIKILQPGLAALLLYSALSPNNWNVGDGVLAFLQWTRVISLVGLIVFGALCVLTVAAVYHVHRSGWTLALKARAPAGDEEP